MTSTRTCADEGEDGVLHRIMPLLGRRGPVVIGPGDDAAVLDVAGKLVVTTDMLVEDEDFRTDWSTARDVGVKAAAQNLADVAAMGAEPIGLVVALGAPGDTPADWPEGLAEGLDAECARAGVSVVGGDLSAAPRLTVSVTAFGQFAGGRPVLRSGAGPGEVVALAGTLGRAAAGLDLLAAGFGDRAGTHGPVAELIGVQRRPTPCYEAGRAAARAGATAMLDVSDGLVRDAGRIAQASGVRIDLDGPFESDLDAVRPAAEALDASGPAAGADGDRSFDTCVRWVLTGGEDHGLLAVFPDEKSVPEQFRVIGSVVAGDPGVTTGGLQLPVGTASGWDHFGGRFRGGDGA
ncbi:thiamine-phosphate kinase [Spelaeicoccus albus]|uniref:Thiamine-monophosphate kinase n=1 Tax=Spelaeicoccus albus TaxID=1280376 RepID=A0A7Z0D2L0_9MICO|nr:thiamine-phosphate kinase [Spelaeicoccus albus]NYI67722.1 thiamine-monophosphate kinase [Spelaeicoccus albus]